MTTPAPDRPAPHDRPDWDHYFVDIARAVAQRSDCRRRQVGAVLVDEGHRIVGTGYTGAPSGHPGCLEGACPRGLLSYEEVKEFSAYDSGPGRCISVHAEANALLYARRDLRGCTAYVTCQPCPTCAKLLAGAGLSRAVFPGDQSDWHSPLVAIDLHDPDAVADPATHGVAVD
ncbi:MAG: deaminase [Dermatophilaceae bacterium]